MPPFWSNKSLPDDDEERTRNLLLYDMYLTDREMEEAGPAAAVIFCLVIAALIAWFAVKFW